MARQKNKKSGFIDNYTELVLKYIKDYDRFISKIAYEVKLKCPKEDVEDIKQQIIYTIFTKRENIKSDLKHMRNTYFSQIALNTAKNYVRTYWQQKNRIYAECLSLDNITYDMMEIHENNIIDYIAEDEESYFNPEKYYENNEFLVKLKSISKVLSPFEKKVFYLYLDGETIAEIAKRCRRSKKTIYNVLASLREKAKIQLKKFN